MDIGAADARPLYADEDVIDPDARDFHFFRPEAGFGFAFDESFQFVSAPELYPTSSFARRSRARM